MSKKYSFPAPGCRQCPCHQKVGITRYCTGFKHREPKLFNGSDPAYKAPKWCPRHITPPLCRIYGFKDEHSACMDLLWRAEYRTGRMKTVSPAAFHYKLRLQIRLGMSARQFFNASHEGPLRDILQEEVNDGEIIEIDDGLQPYYFYVIDSATVFPLPYFRFPSDNRKK